MQRPDGPTTYRDIFDARADRYHRAGGRWPNARLAELDLVASRLGVGPGWRGLDAPCGGGYLAARLP